MSENPGVYSIAQYRAASSWLGFLALDRPPGYPFASGVWGTQAALLFRVMTAGSLTYACFDNYGGTVVFAHVLQGSLLVSGPGSMSLLMNQNHGECAILNGQEGMHHRLEAAVSGVKALELRGLTVESETENGRQFKVDEVPVAERPLTGFRLRSLLAETPLAQQAGYEYVEIEGIVPRHMHERSSAVVVVLSGQGWYGCDWRGGRLVTGIGKDDVIHIPAGQWHGFKAISDDFVIVSVQLPSIEADYRTEEGIDYDYPG